MTDPKLSAKELRAKVDKLEEIVDSYKAALMAKNHDVVALRQKVEDLEGQLKTQRARYDRLSNDGA